ncbi:L-aspartate oxidase [Fictibacillus solisalsi]|uniref:L-aspartate oxidase n=1 Tax=Fictibacillus solisalsi TaxID=459525 RepID=A0A1G9WRH7_9BACL|nr:L-aspartate oxidase [Fictibacillus solisalsi]SDM87080.1 L-aspartate oxidase [Fictibacillus solisalsi]
MNVQFTDVLIIGIGIAGLMAAECLRSHQNVTIITKSSFQNSNSYRAQGGIAAATQQDDHWAEHFLDTIKAGRFHNEEALTEILVKEGPELISLLEKWNVPFDKNPDGKVSLGREGGHRKSRILHAGGDRTGSKMINALFNRVAGHVTIKEHEMVGDLIVEDGRCRGAWTKLENGEVAVYRAGAVILASGGAAGLYSVHSNDESITGDSIALAYRAGALLSDLEFLQFHPTMLYTQGKSFGLVSEAVRGEGGVLLTDQGDRVMKGIHELEDLAPRDIVARTIHQSINQGRKVFLDVSNVKNFTNRFPTITKQCNLARISLKDGWIPVAPGAHFTMGGAVTDEWGRTTVPGLYAVGEASRTGVHGANRLASNSLLEGVVFSKRTALNILEEPCAAPVSAPNSLDSMQTKSAGWLPDKEEIKEKMTKYAGIVRTPDGLSEAIAWFEEYEKCTPDFGCTIHEMEVLNMLQTAKLIVTSAFMRKESRGGHYRTDFPVSNDREWLKKQIYRRKDYHEQAEAKKTAAGIFA